jgi:hypothetical protein
VCPGAGHLSSFFCPGAGHCHAFPARPPGIVNLKKKKVQILGGCPGGGWAMLELTDALVDWVLDHELFYTSGLLQNESFMPLKASIGAQLEQVQTVHVRFYDQ